MPALDFPALFGTGLTERRATSPTRRQAHDRIAAFEALRAP
jgi:hypothetical protein